MENLDEKQRRTVSKALSHARAAFDAVLFDAVVFGDPESFSGGQLVRFRNTLDSSLVMLREASKPGGVGRPAVVVSLETVDGPCQCGEHEGEAVESFRVLAHAFDTPADVIADHLERFVHSLRNNPESLLDGE